MDLFLRIIKRHWFITIHAALFGALSIYFPNSIRGTEGLANTIYNQLGWVVAFIENGGDWSQVGAHGHYLLFRFLSIYPFYTVAFSEPSTMFHWIMLVLFIPLFIVLKRHEDYWAMAILLCYCSFLFSVRIIYPALGIAYFYVLLLNFEKPLVSKATQRSCYCLSFFFCAISSGALLVWFIAQLCYVRRIWKHHPVIWAAFITLFLYFIIGSFLSKYQFYGFDQPDIHAPMTPLSEQGALWHFIEVTICDWAAEQTPMVQKVVAFMMSAVLINTLLQGSLLAKCFLLGTLSLNLYCLYHAVHHKKEWIIFAAPLPLYFLDGPGFTSSLFVNCIYLLHHSSTIKEIMRYLETVTQDILAHRALSQDNE